MTAWWWSARRGGKVLAAPNTRLAAEEAKREQAGARANWASTSTTCARVLEAKGLKYV